MELVEERMEESNVEEVESNEVEKPNAEVEGKKEKTATLPAKLMKSMTLGYWLLLRLKEDNVIDDETYSKAFLDYVKPFADTCEQMRLYESFECDVKMLSKDMKKLIRDNNKPKKEKKEKKVKGKEKEVTSDIVSRIVDAALTSTEIVKPKRKYNRKKTEELNTIDEIVVQVPEEATKQDDADTFAD